MNPRKKERKRKKNDRIEGCSPDPWPVADIPDTGEKCQGMINKPGPGAINREGKPRLAPVTTRFTIDDPQSPHDPPIP